MKTKGISFALMLLVGSLVTPMGFSYAQTSNPTIPLPPRALNATTISSSQIDLSWLAPLDNGGSPLTGYKIETRVACTGNFILILSSATTAITSYSNTGLTNSTCYQYRVYALNAVGTSLPSNNSTATTLQTSVPTHVPNAPTALSVNTLSNTALKLTWSVPSDLGGAPIIGYKIQRNGTTIVNNTSSAQASYVNIGLLAAHQQTYRVAAWNSVGLGPYSNNATGKTGNQTTDIDNLGQQISDFVQQRNELFKQQREETIKVIHECNDKIKNASPENRAMIKAECKDRLKALNEKYKDTRKQFKGELKGLIETIKSQIKDAKDLKIDKEDVKNFKKDLKDFKNETKKEEKDFKKEKKSKKDKHDKKDD
ncbi:MAG: fibronectin type III domain-containing protein [Thaumarchaeota archaeon]|nr:fibronectin type III domain-containing protein [Nitrososphaerota archaeon]